MTIMEALERAKRMHAQKLRDGTEAPGSSAPTRRRRLEVASAAPIVPLDLPLIQADREICEKNRVLISTPLGTSRIRAVDSYRILRTRLRNRMGGEGAVSLGLISAGPDEGKSLTAINLALSFANERRRNVFLIDLDLRNPSVCSYLGVAPTVELGNCLARTARPEDAFFTIGVDNLAVAGGLHSYENSSELLGGPGLAELLEYIGKIDSNALVLVDLPPVLQSADAMVVGAHLSTMLLVVSDGVTRREHLARAVDMLHGMTLAGVVLNRSREAVESYYG
jgi:Mrp family chromosome partitioning ATPase